jgi:DNA-binding beta-propeller fold protein YncE
MKIIFLSLRLFCLLLWTGTVASHAAESYRFLKEIPVGGEGGWDYLSVDAANHRLYVAHATKVVVIDTQTDTIVGEIADTPGVHGVAVANRLERAFVSNGKENKVSIVDLSTLKTLSKVETEKNPDAILFVPGPDEVYAFNGHSQSVTVIAAGPGKVVTTVPLGGKPEFAQADPQANRIYDNLEDKNEVVVLDGKTHDVVARWPIAPGEEASGMDIDLVHHRLFLGCGNQKMVVLDSTDGHVVASLPAGDGIDAASFDPGTQLAFTSNGRDGTVTVVHEDGPDKYSVVQTLKTERSARTMAVDPATHKLYLASAKFEEVPKDEKKRPPMIPGTFKVLVYELTN